VSTTTEQMRAWQGPAILGYGFRPLFLGAGVWAALAMALWIAAVAGALALPTRFAPVDWHAHELLYGYLPAVMAGFLFTAVPNWTGRLPIVGWPLLALVSIWVGGRVTITTSALLPAAVAPLIDLAFLALVAAMIGREILAGKNWRNLPVLAAVGLLWVGNLVFHFEGVEGAASGGFGARIGIAVAIFLVLLIGGRIVPSFTRNWLAQRGSGSLPAPPGNFDAIALAVAGLALVAWIAAPAAPGSGALCCAAGLAHLWRLARWAGWRSFAEPLVAVLHVGYLFASIGFLAVAASILVPGSIATGAALHAWTAGAVGVMTLAVMTRASLGHTGRPLTATPAIEAIYATAIAAAVLRIIDGITSGSTVVVTLAGLLWIAAFGGFVVAFFRLLVMPRGAVVRRGRPGNR
jgi:uncharacterized protein involved in response to NO